MIIGQSSLFHYLGFYWFWFGIWYNKMAVLHFYSSKFHPNIYSILFGFYILHNFLDLILEALLNAVDHFSTESGLYLQRIVSASIYR